MNNTKTGGKDESNRTLFLCDNRNSILGTRMISKQTHALNNSDKKLVLMHVGYNVTIFFCFRLLHL